MNDELLTTRDASRLLGVSPSTVKRWSEQGLLACEHTAGGHRRFRQSAIRALWAAADRGATTRESRPAAVVELGDSEVGAWINRLLATMDVAPTVAALRAWYDALGSWWRVADRLGAVLTAVGHAWASGAITVLEEHLVSERLRRAILRCAEDFPAQPGAPCALLATANGEDHDLGLVLCELVLREGGWTVLWSGRRSPLRSLEDYVRQGGVALMALSASSYATDTIGLAQEAETLASACRQAGATLMLGGAGLWPEPPPLGAFRIHGFGELATWLRTVS